MAVNSIMDGLGGYVPYLFILAAGVIALRWRLPSSPTESRAPPLVKSTIPLIGHIIGMFRYKTEYFEMLCTKHPLPICSIQMGPSKVCIAMSPDVVQSALRNRALSFDPFSMAFVKRVLGTKSEKFAATSYTPKDDKEICYNTEMHKVYHEPLQPGPDLQQTNAAVLHQVSKFMNEIGPEYERKELYTWIRDSFTVATSIALFGSRNPFPSDPSLTDALWDFEAGIQMLMLDFLPYFTAHKAHLGRAKVQSAMRAYFHAGYDLDDDVSTFIKRRTFIQRKYGFGPAEMGDWDLAMMLVATTNAIPTLFWTVVYVLSSPSIAAAIRAEVNAITRRTTDPATGETRALVDAAGFQRKCPVLCAAYQESLRLSNRQMSIRVAEVDTTVSAADRTYFLKKNTVLLIPSNIYSEDPAVWGPDAHLFLPARWLKEPKEDKEREKEAPSPSPSVTAKEVERVQKKAFFPFGGGRHLCPGRHFALAEILGMVALLVVGYDVAMSGGDAPAVTGDGDGEPVLRVPRRESRFFGEGVPKPAGGVYEVLIRRKGGVGEEVRWGFEFGG